VARGCGADAVLLMVSVLGDEVADHIDLAETLGLAALVEGDVCRGACDREAAGARIVGVNARDMRTLEVDREARPAVVAEAAGHGLITVAASACGRRTTSRAAAAGAAAVLVGELLMRSRSPEEMLEALVCVERRPGVNPPRRRARDDRDRVTVA